MTSGRSVPIGHWALIVMALSLSACLGSAGLRNSGLPRDVHRRYSLYVEELRIHAAFPTNQRSWYPCDEEVGRYCLQYGLGKDQKPLAESDGLRMRRAEAVEAFQRLAIQRPHDTLVAGPLVRMLVEGDRTRDAVDAALAFAAADTSDAWSYLFLGFALNADLQTVVSERAFGEALKRMSPSGREAVASAYFLLAPEERVVHAALEREPREVYEEELWRASDPLYLTDGNETRAEHLFRYVYARILAGEPSTGGFSGDLRAVGWKEDSEELTRRFGAPSGTLAWECNPFIWNPSENEYWARNADQVWNPFRACVNSGTRRGYYHPDQLTYVPPRFSRQRLPPPAEPGTGEWFYGPVARENGFLPRTVRTMRPLEHQLSRFPVGNSTVLRADVAFELDEIAPANGPVELGLFVLDSALAVIGEVRDTVTALGRFAWGGLETRLPDGAWAYSVEAREMGTWQAARSRHPLPPPPEGTLTISDLVLLPSRPEIPLRGQAAFRPFGSLLLDRDKEVAMYLEVRGLATGEDGLLHYRMDLRVLKGDDEESGSGTLTWTDEHPPVEMLPVTADLGRLPTEGGVGRAVADLTDLLTGGDSGLQTLVLTVTDLVTGEISTVRRRVKVR